MKKKYIIIGALLLLVIAAVICAVVFGGDGEKPPENPPKGITILDSKGNLLVEAKATADILDAENWAYLEVALTEAGAVLAEQSGSTPQEALDTMLAEGYTIRTAFDMAAFQAIQQGVDETQPELACALTDLEGRLLAVYSSPTGNYATARISPYSAFKPLSVYAPALEKGIANWSKMYEDTPYKKLENDSGELQDWPANDTGAYSQKQVPVCEAIQVSLNTVAVRCLAELGISTAMDFLKTSFDIPLKEESYVVKTYGEEEVIGNIALGYLETGVTPIEMAGYYQIFANGGSYIQPSAVMEIANGEGQTVYTRKAAAKQVISPATADVMNKLLQGVVSAKGTGAAAQCGDIQVAGKTGTGDDYSDNWFVGVTPGYSLAVWHGMQPSNTAAKMFSKMIKALYAEQPNANKQFITHQNLNQVIYCAHSGKAISDDCTLIDMGYYQQSELPVCDACKKNKTTEVDRNE